MPHRLILRCSLLIVVALIAAAPALARQQRPAAAFRVSSAGAAKAAPAEDDIPALYIVQLADPPAAVAGDGQAALRVEAGQRAALNAIAKLRGRQVEPVHSYRHAFNGFAITLTPAEAAAVAALPGVKAVERDYEQQLHTDTGPAFIGAAQADQGPAIFRADLAAGGASGRATFVYDEAAGALNVQLFYQGLSGPPNAARLHLGAPGQSGPAALSLNTLARQAGSSGAYVGSVSLATLEPGVSTDEFRQALSAGNVYVNLSTSVQPGGELRGQLEPVRGAGVLVGVLDSGIDFTSPSFADPGGDGFDHTNPRGAGNYLGVCDPNDQRFDPAFVCNDKLIGAYTYAETDESPDPHGSPSPRDNHGHGTHTASTAVGGLVASAGFGGAELGPIGGVAPHATLIAYDVCGIEPASNPQNSLRCSTAAILAAIDQAVADGVDVINYSIGGSSRDPWASDDSEAFLAATSAGVFVAASAGNTGPEPGSVGAPSNAPWVTSVAATTHNRSFVNNLAGFTGGNANTRPTAPLAGRGYSAPFGPAPLVEAAAFNDTKGMPNGRCDSFAPGTDLQGAIVICQRAGVPRTSMVANVRAANGGAAVLINDALSGEDLVDEPYQLPAVYLGYSAGQALRAWTAGCADCEARIEGTTRDLDPARGDLLAGFSGRGPDRSNPDVLKPDLAAPGVNILASSLNIDPNGPDFQLSSGTSMAAPHVAGAAALLKELHPDWSVAEIKSALMLTATPGVRDETAPATPFGRGAGRISVGRAALAGLVLDESYAAFLAANPASGGSPASLNLASLAQSACPITCVFTRTVRSTLGITATWSAAGSAAAPLTVTVSPATFTLPPGAEQTITITAETAGASEGNYLFGEVTLTEQTGLAPTATFPLAVRPTASSLPRELTLTTRATGGSHTLDVRAQATSALTLSGYGLVRLTPAVISLPTDPTPADIGDFVAGGLYTRTLILPAGTTRFRAQINESSAPDLDLYLYKNLDGDNLLDPGELLCFSATERADEYCDLLADDPVRGLPTPLPVTVLVQNYQGSRPQEPTFADSFILATGMVERSAAGNLTLSAPDSVPAGQPFELEVNWMLQGARYGDTYIGVVSLGSEPAKPGDFGSFSFTLHYQPYRVFAPLQRR